MLFPVLLAYPDIEALTFGLGVKTTGTLVLLSIGILLIAAYVPWFRRIVFHPDGQELINAVLGGSKLYLFPLYFSPLRMRLLRDFRARLHDHPRLRQWSQKNYIAPEIHSESLSENIPYQQMLQHILDRGQGTLWLVQSKTGYGKSALVEQWTQQLLLENKTPFLLSSPGVGQLYTELKLTLEQWGDLRTQEDQVQSMLWAGGFVIILDGLDEGQIATEAQDFIRSVLNRNIIILCSDNTYEWDNIAPHIIRLRPFETAQWETLGLSHSSIEELKQNQLLYKACGNPYTALQLKTFVDKNNKLPSFRSELYQLAKEQFFNTAQEKGYLHADRILAQAAWTALKNNDSSSNLPSDLESIALECDIFRITHKQFVFHAPGLQRYLAAFHLYHHQNKSEELLKPLFEDKPSWAYSTEAADTFRYWAEYNAIELIQSKAINFDKYEDFIRGLIKTSNVPTLLEGVCLDALTFEKNGLLKLSEKFKEEISSFKRSKLWSP